MMRRLILLAVFAALLFPVWDEGAVQALQDGTLLRMHVLAEDDTPAMQAMKAPVRDAVRACYAARADDGCSMLENAQRLLPHLTAAAQQAAKDAGYTGAVAVDLGVVTFDDRLLEGVVVPAGAYPALTVRMGAARGHNWWGLLDPDSSLLAACAGEEEEALVWDWSPRAFWHALVRSFTWRRGGDAA